MFLRKQKSHPPSQPKQITSDCSNRLSDLSWKTLRNGKSPSFLVNTLLKISRQRPFPNPQPTKTNALFSTQKFADWHPTYFAYDVAETSASAIASPATISTSNPAAAGSFVGILKNLQTFSPQGFFGLFLLRPSDEQLHANQKTLRDLPKRRCCCPSVCGNFC